MLVRAQHSTPELFFDKHFKNKKEFSISEIISVLNAPPFSILDDEEACLIARYMVEDNT